MCNTEAFKASVSKERLLQNITNPYQATLAGLRDVGIVPKKKISVDPEAERMAANATATQQANSRIAFQRRAMRENSLLTGGGLQAGAGRSTLGV